MLNNPYINEDTILYWNGNYENSNTANISLYSQSLHYGYAVFEGIRSYNVNSKSKAFKLKEHFERLQYSCNSAIIPFNYSYEKFKEIVYQVLEKNNLIESYIRPLVVCSPNMGLTKGVESYLIVQAWEWAGGYISNNIKIMTSSYERPNPKAFDIKAKISGHYINSIMASNEAKSKGFNEGMLLDQNGNVAEASGANIFYEKDGILYTPPVGYILPGITRATCIDLAKSLGIVVIEKFFKPKEMQGADAAFFCGTAAEVVAIDSLNKIDFVKPWQETNCKKIQDAYKKIIVEESIKNEVFA